MSKPEIIKIDEVEYVRKDSIIAQSDNWEYSYRDSPKGMGSGWIFFT